MEVTRDEAWRLFCEWTESDSLRKHVLGVEAAMVGLCARGRRGRGTVGRDGHPPRPRLREATRTSTPAIRGSRSRNYVALGYPEEMIDAIAGHATFLGVPRETPLSKTLFAVDELSGFIHACARVRPTGIHGLTPKSVKKKLKTPSFAAGVNRDEVRQGAEDLGVDFDEHIAKVVAAMEERSGELGLDTGAGA